MDQPKTYFIFRPTVYKPNDLIRLGQIITDPRKPFQRLAEPLPLKGPLKPRSAPALEWSATNTKTGEVSVGIFSHVVNMMTVEASAEKSQNETQTWDAAILETRFFEISEDPSYVEQTAKVPAVDMWLKQYRHQGKTVYMITGLKIAKHPGKVTYDSSNTSSLSANLKTTVDPQGLVDTGGHAKAGKSAKTTNEATPEVEYIFGYRLRRLKVMWRKLELKDDLEGGELYSNQSKQFDANLDRDKQHRDSDFEIEGVSLEEDDFGATLPARDKKLQAFDEDDNRPCLVIPVATMNL
ncbi:hypothetical protein F5883DRAFT_244342 [Diaporthe sp. PMI_573]|nr:hypothetical protein F5883DRAFT_244342 [Diaporthaceae sp. PMI_573]